MGLLIGQQARDEDKATYLSCRQAGWILGDLVPSPDLEEPPLIFSFPFCFYRRGNRQLICLYIHRRKEVRGKEIMDLIS